MLSYDNRNRKVAQAFVKIMNEAGISFAILGNAETNSGDTARCVGNEFLFQELAQQNIELSINEQKHLQIYTTKKYRLPLGKF